MMTTEEEEVEEEDEDDDDDNDDDDGDESCYDGLPYMSDKVDDLHRNNHTNVLI